MAKNQSIPKDGYDRLRNVAFWYWEYQRRNAQYRRWSNVVEWYFDYFDSIGELERVMSPETFHENIKQADTPENEGEYYDTPFIRHLEEKHGSEATLKFFKMSILGAKFDQKFMRMFRYRIKYGKHDSSR